MRIRQRYADGHTGPECSNEARTGAYGSRERAIKSGLPGRERESSDIFVDVRKVKEMNELVTADDLSPGDRVELGHHTLTQEEIVEFADQWDPQWFHTDPDAAAEGHHGGLIASGIHTLAVLQRLCVDALYSRWAVIAGRGFDRLRFTAPVRPGDTLTGSVAVTDVSLDDSRGRIQLEMEMRRADSTVVLAATMTVFVWRRGNLSYAGL